MVLTDARVVLKKIGPAVRWVHGRPAAYGGVMF